MTTRVAWLISKTHDVWASQNHLYVDGVPMNLPKGSVHPVQIIINLAYLGKRDAKARIAAIVEKSAELALEDSHA